MTGMIFNIQRFSIQDGPGIRTTVFMKGCPLDCDWCHNPESKDSHPQISFHPDKCIKCGFCTTVCKNNAHTIIDDNHLFDRVNCNYCGLCTEKCYSTALEKIGYEISPSEVILKVLADKSFYENSSGGMTLSGGEPMCQPEFSLEIVKMAKKENLHVCIETSGYCKTEDILAMVPYVDIFLYDYKISNDELHKNHTGVSNKLILKNLKAIDTMGASIILRCPLIQDINLNDDHINGIIDIVKSLKNVIEINLEPYHPLGISKSGQIGKQVTYNNSKFLERHEIEAYKELISSKTGVAVTIL